MQLYSQIRFSTVMQQDMQLNPKGKDTGRVQRNACVGFQICSLPPVRSHTGHTFPTATNVQQHMCDVSTQGCPLKAQCPRCLWGASHIGILWFTKGLVTYENSRLYQEAGVSHIPYCLHSLGSVNQLVTQLQIGNFESQVHKCQPRSTLPAGFSYNSNLRFAM